MKFKVKPLYIISMIYIIVILISLYKFTPVYISFCISIIISVYLSNNEDIKTIWKNKKGFIKKDS